MDIGHAVMSLKNGVQVRRRGWNGSGMYLDIYTPREDEDMTKPFVFIHTVQGDYIPWTCSQADLLANDWEEVSDDREE